MQARSSPPRSCLPPPPPPPHGADGVRLRLRMCVSKPPDETVAPVRVPKPAPSRRPRWRRPAEIAVGVARGAAEAVVLARGAGDVRPIGAVTIDRTAASRGLARRARAGGTRRQRLLVPTRPGVEAEVRGRRDASDTARLCVSEGSDQCRSGALHTGCHASRHAGVRPSQPGGRRGHGRCRAQ